MSTRILIVTPAPPGSRKGNRVTAQRWARLLRELGHRVTIAERFSDQRCDVMVALHARRSADSIAAFRRRHPRRPLIVTLTGTDLYHDLPRSRPAQRSLQLADRLVLLQQDGLAYLPEEVRAKGRVIYQSAVVAAGDVQPLRTAFEVCVLGHLRDVKDPFRTAMAARRLPESSRIRVTHAGAALSEAMAERARREMQRNARYRWIDDVPHGRALRVLRRSRLLVVSSKLEGAPNVASEALAAGTPMLATRISGMLGLLGPDYPGYFPVGDTQQLAQLLQQAETDKAFYRSLQEACERVRHLVTVEHERDSWQQLLAELDW